MSFSRARSCPRGSSEEQAQEYKLWSWHPSCFRGLLPLTGCVNVHGWASVSALPPLCRTIVKIKWSSACKQFSSSVLRTNQCRASLAVSLHIKTLQTDVTENHPKARAPCGWLATPPWIQLSRQASCTLQTPPVSGLDPQPLWKWRGLVAAASPWMWPVPGLQMAQKHVWNCVCDSSAVGKPNAGVLSPPHPPTVFSPPPPGLLLQHGVEDCSLPFTPTPD